MSTTPLADKLYVQARRPVSYASSVLIQNIPTQRCTEDWLEMYFTNKNKSGVESYKAIEVLDHGMAIIHFNNKSGKIISFIFIQCVICHLVCRHGDSS